MTVRSVERVIEAEPKIEGGGFLVHRPFPTASLDHIDPFLLLDEMGPVDYRPGQAAGAPDHPHRGFETVTYLLEGSFEHKDSSGESGTLLPGDVQWMTAGAGVVHSEMPSAAIQRAGGRVHGFQIWVNLPARSKMTTPRYQTVPASTIPTLEREGLRVRVIAGRHDTLTGPVETHSPVLLLHATLARGATLRQAVPADHNLFAYLLSGAAEFGRDAIVAHERQAPLFGRDGDEATVVAGPEGVSLLLLGGRPLGEPVARAGPFVMNSRAELHQAFADYEAGRMGAIRK